MDRYAIVDVAGQQGEAQVQGDDTTAESEHGSTPDERNDSFASNIDSARFPG